MSIHHQKINHIKIRSVTTIGGGRGGGCLVWFHPYPLVLCPRSEDNLNLPCLYLFFDVMMLNLDVFCSRMKNKIVYKFNTTLIILQK
jgi:hypothetical protein